MSIYTHEGRTYGLGAKPRPADPKELAYRLTAPTAVDVTRPRSLARFASPVKNQGQEGSCVAHAVTSAAELLARTQGLEPPPLDRLWLYARTRQKEGTFPQDAGSYPADSLDIALTGLPREACEPGGYKDSPGQLPDPSADADAPNQDYVVSHRPFYSSDSGGFLAGILTALDGTLPVVLAMGWHRDFFGPTRGILPVRTNDAGIVGGHCVHVWGFVPQNSDHGPLVACRNSWGSWTGSTVAQVHPDAVDGDFFLPAELLTNGIVWECRAVSPEAVTPQPTPTPEPPADRFTKGYASALQVALVTEADALAYAKAKPSSVTRKWWSLGVQWSRFAIQNNAPAGMPGATGEGKQPR